MRAAMLAAGVAFAVFLGCAARPDSRPTPRSADELPAEARDVVRDSLAPPLAFGDLEVTLQARKTEYRVGEPVEVELRLSNTSNRFLCVYNEAMQEGWLVFLDIVKDGKPEYQSRRIPFDRTAAHSHYAWIPPGGFVGQRLTGWKPSEPGTYMLAAEYANDRYQIVYASMKLTPEDLRVLGERAFVTVWTGRSRSNVIQITVKK